jgi:predicted nuclease of predicted toxin-antitoxin system
VRFLVDAQLPPRLAAWFIGEGCEGLHVAALPGGLQMSDFELWHRAASDGSIIVSKDRDFLDLSAVRGAPPIVLHVAVGNISTTDLIALLHRAWPLLQAELARGDAKVVTLEREHVTALRRT